MPSTFFDPSFSLRRLRTTPARKPRTECCCQPVTSIIEAIVAPAGDCSIAITRECFEFGSIELLPRADCCDDFEANTGATEATDDFFAGFDIEILRLVDDSPRAVTTEAPSRPQGRRGRISERRFGAPGIVDSTAPTAAICQSILDNNIARFRGIRFSPIRP